MKLARVKIQNLRSIEVLEIFPKNYTSLIGPNNAGKSSVLRGIELLLSQSKPELDEWRKGHEAEPIVIEAEFDQLEEWERKKPGVAALVHNNKITLRAIYKVVKDKKGNDAAEMNHEAFKPEETFEGWTEETTWTTLPAEIKALAVEAGIESKVFKNDVTKERIRDLVREKLPRLYKRGEPKWTGEGFSIPNALQQALPQPILVPAIRDPEDDSSPGAGSSFGKLLKELILPAVNQSDEFKALLGAVKNLESKLRATDSGAIKEVDELTKKLSARLDSLIKAKVRVGMEPPDADKFIGGNTVLRLDDGVDTRVVMQGHGLQRALIFAMIEVLAERSTRSADPDAKGEVRSKVLLFEEPELFIHPHLMRRLQQALQDLAKRPDWQVLVTTHSPVLVDVATDPCSLVIHQRPNPVAAPQVQQLKKDPLEIDEREALHALLAFHPTVCEAFFAQHAVLVEGDSEMAVLSKYSKLHELAGIGKEQVQNTTLVSCDGKWTIAPVARLLKHFQVPFRVVHDRDAKGRSSAVLAALPGNDEYKANERIELIAGKANVFQVDDTFEHTLWPGATATHSKDKPFKAWRRARELTVGKADLTHVPQLRDVLEFAFKPFAAPVTPSGGKVEAATEKPASSTIAIAVKAYSDAKAEGVAKREARAKKTR